jgi:lysophospholipase L1-like esterase
MHRRSVLRIGILFAPMSMLLVACDRKRPRSQPVPAGATVLALGDSLTYGTGATPDTSYPAELARLTGWQVVNAGVPGDTSAQAAERLPVLLAEHAPKLVVVSIGGNDFLRRVPEAETRAQIERIVRASLASGAQVLVAVPKPSAGAAVLGSLTDHPMVAELADTLGVPLQRQGWSEVLSDEALRSDRIHANAAGYAQMAKKVKSTALAVGLLAR